MRAAAILALVLFAGCLEPGPTTESNQTAPTPMPRADRPNGTVAVATPAATIVPPAAPDSPAFAFHLLLPCDACGPNATSEAGGAYLFLVDGGVIRAVLVEDPRDDRTDRAASAWAPVFQALDGAGAGHLAPRDAQRIMLANDTHQALRRAVEEDWSPPEDFADAPPCGRPCPAILGRGISETWDTIDVERSPILGSADNEGFRALLAAMHDAERSFEHAQPEGPGKGVDDGGAIQWQGQDSEFGTIRTPYRIAIPHGSRAPIEARVVLRETYAEQDARFFMFKWTVENAPLDVAFDNLYRVDTGAELPCYQREGTPQTGIACFVDLGEMPPAGTEVRMVGSVGASHAGFHQVGALVVPFTSIWTRVPMSNGLDAELYAGTFVEAEEAPTRSIA